MKLNAMALLVPMMALSMSAFAGTQEQKLVSITNDRDANYSDVDVLVDTQTGMITGLKYITHNDGEISTKSFPTSALGSTDGAALEEQQGVKAVTLSGHSTAVTGTWNFRYISNGLSGTYESCQVGIARDNQGKWALINPSSGARIESAKIITWAMGITTIQGICN